MAWKALIAQDTVATVALVAQGVGRFTLGRVVGRLIVVRQNRRMQGSVRPPSP